MAPVDLISPKLASYISQSIAVLDPPPSTIYNPAPGAEVAHDDCCEGGGQLWVRIISILPHITNATQAASAPCGVDYWVVNVGLGVVRCAHSLDDAGNAPTPEEVSGDGMQMIADLNALQQVVLCNELTWRVASWQPVGPGGGCAGGEWLFSIRVGTCGCE